MINRLDNDNSLEVLQSIADKHDLLLSDNLIDFASEVWRYAYIMGMRDESMANQGETK